MLVLGLRKGELLGLAREDVDLPAGELILAWQLQRLGNRLVRRETKTVAALQRLWDQTRDCLTVVGPDWAGNRPIFTTGLGTPVEPRNVNRRWVARIEAAGYVGSPSMVRAGPAGRCWWTSTSIHG